MKFAIRSNLMQIGKKHLNLNLSFMIRRRRFVALGCLCFVLSVIGLAILWINSGERIVYFPEMCDKYPNKLGNLL